MITAETKRSPLEGHLPAVRGSLEFGAPMSRLTWFRTGGPAEALFRPADLSDLTDFLAALSKDVPVTLVGVGSNLIVRDGGIKGVVIRLGKPFAELRVEANRIVAGAGAMDITVSHLARDSGIAGLEFFRGVPGSVGGAIRMNAGAYGREVKDVLVSVSAVDRGGKLHTLKADEIAFTYRGNDIDPNWIIVEACFEGRPGDPAEIQKRMNEISAAREESQPLRTRTGGSTFKNPPGQSAWKLIEKSGCRGLTRGGATVSEKHCNFLLNTGEATSRDLEALGEEVRRRVKEATGVTLEWEIERIGEIQGIGR